MALEFFSVPQPPHFVQRRSQRNIVDAVRASESVLALGPGDMIPDPWWSYKQLWTEACSKESRVYIYPELKINVIKAGENCREPYLTFFRRWFVILEPCGT